MWDRLGEEGIRALVTAFYGRMRRDDLVGRMYPPDDWEGAEERLAEFLFFRLGADQRYLEKRGHPRLRARHLPFRIGVAERDRWVDLMDGALSETVEDLEVREMLKHFFREVADFLRNTPG